MDPTQSSDDLSLRSNSPFLQLSRANSRNSINNFTNTTIYHQVEIRPRDSFKFFVRAEEPLETLHFSFYTRKKSIGFGLFYLYLPNLSSESVNEKGEAKAAVLPIEKVRELIAMSKDNVKLQKMGQEGSLARTFSTRNKPNLLTLNSINSRSTDNLSVTEFVGESPQLNNLEQLKKSQKLKIGELIEILPIRKYNSFDYTLEGAFTIPLTGTYVLLFDNSFSIGTSKHLFYHAYLSADIIPSPSATPQLLSSGQVGSLCAAGWLSKRRTGVVRSWSRRWFQLDSLGILSYFEDRASPLRGSIFVPDCSLIIAKKSLKFSLDSGSQIFHLQAYKKEEFDFWIQVLSSFKHFGPPTTLTSSHQLPQKSQDQSTQRSSVKSKLDETFKFVRARLDSLTAKKEEPAAEIGETLMKLETIYNLLQKTREDLEAEGGEKAEEAEEYSDVTEEYEEVFYDVEEIYVDDIEEEAVSVSGLSVTGLSVESEEEEEVFEAAIEYEETKQVTVAPMRIATDWILKADLSLPRDETVIFRTNMPFPAPPINISFASVIMRKSFPVALNEPINLLQRLAEELEYSDLLDKAAGMGGDPVEQMIYVTAFAVSGYASSIHRSERKPYNPVLGETFEYIRPDRGFRFISEKVSHQPVIVACHAESKKWRFWQDVQAETKLWGKSMLITPKGKIHLELLDEESGEVRSYFVWSKVSGALRNVYSAKKSIENYGELVIKNRTAGLESRITFKESGMFSNSGNEIQGGIYKLGNEDELVTLSGRWDDMLCKEVKGKVENLLQVIWRTNPLPSNYAQFFHLTSFAVTLNDFPDLLRKVLPSSDSRYRPDQRMLESGMVDAADMEKQRIEQLQRDKRNSSDPIQPLWFKFDEKSRSWKFNEKYWKERESNFSHTKIPKLW